MNNDTNAPNPGERPAFPEAERVTTTTAKQCPTCQRHHNRTTCPYCAELTRRRRDRWRDIL